MSDHAEIIRAAVSHIARGCRARTSHDPSVYIAEIEAALDGLLADHAAEIERWRQVRGVAQKILSATDDLTDIPEQPGREETHREWCERVGAIFESNEPELRAALAAAQEPPVTVTPILASCFLHGDHAGDECPECAAKRWAAAQQPPAEAQEGTTT